MNRDDILWELNRRLEVFTNQSIYPIKLNEKLQSDFFVIEADLDLQFLPGWDYITTLIWEFPYQQGNFFLSVDLKDPIEKNLGWKTRPCTIESARIIGIAWSVINLFHKEIEVVFNGLRKVKPI